MSLVIYNSLTNRMEEFNPSNKEKVNMYVCGPTVYNYIHIGNARPVIFYDMVKRYLEFCGYQVTYASNITDIDDKIINAAKAENISEKELAKKYEKAFFEATKLVGSKFPDLIPHATEYIPQMIEFIKELEEKGYAYNIDGDVYFRINKIKDYGILSNQVQEDLNSGVRIDVSDKKENPMDFTLWKKTDVGIKWDSPFGEGRPGWHTECVVMNHNLFGDTIDIHGGGMDIKFPHHENEIAQAKAMYNTNLAKYWMHVGRLQLNGEKMSKSLGNCIYVKDIENPEEFMILRLLIIASPYRSAINYNEELVAYFSAEYEKIKRAYRQAMLYVDYNNISSTNLDDNDILEFKEAMDQDFNTPNVLTLIDRLVKELNNFVRQKNDEKLIAKLNTLKTILGIWGIKVPYDALNEETKELYTSWIKARNEKDFENSDRLRGCLVEKGVL